MKSSIKNTPVLTKAAFANAIGKAVKQSYGLEDGSDLAYNLLEDDVLQLSMTIDAAAQVVAQHLAQP